MQKHEEVKANRKSIIVNNFLGGVAWSVGTTVGLTIVVTFIGLLFRQIGLVPVFGRFITQITDFFAQGSH